MIKNKGFTLLELMVAILIIGIVSCFAATSLLRDIPLHQAENGIIIAEQAIKAGQSTAIKASQTTIVDFSGSTIQIKDPNGTVLQSFPLEENVVFNSDSSTIADRKVIFNFQGEPVNSAGSVGGITSNNNTIAISYLQNGHFAATKQIKINPLTGNIEEN